MSLSIFYVGSINSEFGTKENLNFNDLLWAFYDSRYLSKFKYEQNILERISPYISCFETFASNRPFICHHHQIIKQ